MIASIEDITARRRDERRIEALIDEKDRALRESHHRVTNNMNIVHSLLSLHADTLDDESGREALRKRLFTAGELLRQNQLAPESGALSDVAEDRQLQLFEFKAK